MVCFLGLPLTCLLHILVAWLGVVGFPCTLSLLSPRRRQGPLVLEEGRFLKEAASKVVGGAGQ